MANIPLNVILMWAGTNATIPSGWSRETDLDSKYPKASGNEDPATTGGSSTHTHTSPAHSHTMVSHSHSVGTSSAVQSSQRSNNDGSSSAYVFHVHNTSVAGVSGGTLSDAVTYASANTSPPYFSVIFISPSTNPQSVPDDVIALWNETEAPANFAFTDGDNGTVDMRNRYVKGTTPGGNGGTTGGSLNHEHDIGHNHTTQSHTHSATSATPQPKDAGTGSGSPVSGNHTHTISLPSASSATNAYSGNAGSAEDVEPLYKKLMAIQNNSGSSKSAPLGTIALWLGNVVDIPTGWQLCDGTNDTPDLTDYYVKIANDTDEIGDTGGSNTHTHAASNSHTHTATGTHTHSTGGSTSSVGTAASGISGGSANNDPVVHHHTITSVSSTTATYNSTTVSADSSSNEPEYIIAAYIQLLTETGGASLLYNFV